MRVGELIEQLQKEDPQTQVFVASDEEGNSFHELADIGTYYSPNADEYDIEIYNKEDLETEPELKESFDAGELDEVLVIWP